MLAWQCHLLKMKVGVECSENPYLRRRISWFWSSCFFCGWGTRRQIFMWTENKDRIKDTKSVGSWKNEGSSKHIVSVICKRCYCYRSECWKIAVVPRKYLLYSSLLPIASFRIQRENPDKKHRLLGQELLFSTGRNQHSGTGPTNISIAGRIKFSRIF